MIIIDLNDGSAPLEEKTEFLSNMATSRSGFALDVMTSAGKKFSPHGGFRFYKMAHRNVRENPADRPSEAGLVLCSGLGQKSPTSFAEPVTQSRDLLAYCEGLQLSCFCGYLPEDTAYTVMPVGAAMDGMLPFERREWCEEMSRLDEMGIRVFVDAAVAIHIADEGLPVPNFSYDILPFASTVAGFAWIGEDDKFVEDNACGLAGMQLAGLVATLMEGRSLGWNTFPHGRLSPWEVVDVLCFGKLDDISKLAAAQDGQGAPRIRHLDMSGLFAKGKAFEKYAGLHATVSDISAIWKSCLDDANMRVAVERHISDETLVAALDNAAGHLGIEEKVAAYLSGVPLEDIVSGDGKMRGYH